MKYSKQINQNNKIIHSGFQHPIILEKSKITLRYRHESSKNCANYKKKRNWIKRWRRVTNESSKTILLDRYPAYRNRITCSRKYPSRVSWYICKTQNGLWVEHGAQSETHTERWQSCLQPKLTHADPPERRFNRWTRPYAQIRDYHSLTLLKVCESHFCPTKTNWKITSPCGSQENQHPDRRWLY